LTPLVFTMSGCRENEYSDGCVVVVVVMLAGSDSAAAASLCQWWLASWCNRDDTARHLSVGWLDGV